jgi:hypothetical protein
MDASIRTVSCFGNRMFLSGDEIVGGRMRVEKTCLVSTWYPIDARAKEKWLHVVSVGSRLSQRSVGR